MEFKQQICRWLDHKVITNNPLTLKKRRKYGNRN